HRWPSLRTQPPPTSASVAHHHAIVEVCVKAALGKPDMLSDCEVLLMLEEKNPYEVKLVDLGNKPEWSVSFPPAFCSLHEVSHQS
ncbi:hypothetical protein ACJX0J_007515, partial [Zea mays]